MDSSVQVLILLLLLSGFFSGSETALTAISPAKIRTLVEGKKRSAHIIASLKKNPDRLLITILIGNNVVNIAASVMATAVAQESFGNEVLSIVVGVMTLLILIFGEIVPKTISQRFPILFAQITSPILLVLSYVLFPAIIVLEWITKSFVWLLGADQFKSVTEEEVIAMLNIGHEEGEFNQQESEFIQNIFEFSDTTAEEIMVNRNEIEAFASDITLEKAMKSVDKATHSRMPVYEGSIDNIIGYITLKDILKLSRKATNLKKPLRELKLHKILFFPVTKPINKIFRSFQAKRIHMAIILDEFGSTAGLITIEDVLEEIVGDIVDESDIEVAAIRKVGKNSFHLEANTTLEEIFEYQRFSIDIPEHKTVAFLIIKKLGAFPREGEKVILHDQGIEFVVEKMAGKAIQKVKMTVKKPKKKDEDDD